MKMTVFFALMMEAASTSETSVNFFTRLHGANNPEDSHRLAYK
jgi:hypothetical protein